MKIYLISDIHLLPPGELSHGVDTAARFQRALDDLARNHSDASLCIFLGDLSDHGETEAYKLLRRMLAEVKTPLLLTLGNHDDRANFAEVFPERVAAPANFTHHVHDTPFGRLIVLDTHEPGWVSGRLCAERLAWLEAKVAEAEGRPLYVFLHHPPFDTGGRVDGLKLVEHKELGDILARHKNVRQIVAGHTHRLCSGVWRGIPFANLGSTTYNLAMHAQGQKWGERQFGPLLTGVLLLGDDNVVLHANDVRADNGAVTEVWYPEELVEEMVARGGRPAEA